MGFFPLFMEDAALDQLLPLIGELVRRGANFKERVDEVETGIPCIDYTCQ